MPYHHDTYDWFWMVPMMILWVIVLGLAVYVAVTLANKHSDLRDK